VRDELRYGDQYPLPVSHAQLPAPQTPRALLPAFTSSTPVPMKFVRSCGAGGGPYRRRYIQRPGLALALKALQATFDCITPDPGFSGSTCWPRPRYRKRCAFLSRAWPLAAQQIDRILLLAGLFAWAVRRCLTCTGTGRVARGDGVALYEQLLTRTHATRVFHRASASLLDLLGRRARFLPFI